MWGVQGLITMENQKLDFSGTRKKTRITGRTEIYFQYARGKEWLGEERREVGDVFNAPRWQFQFRIFFTVNKFELMFATNRQTSVLSKAVIYKDEYARKTIQERYPTFRSWDMMMRLYLSNHFLLYLQAQNLFNRHYSGLDATGTQDDLLYNPQQGRLLRFGVNYNMN
jgi:outer membrane receptor protein involved in Fe transport